MHDLTALTPLGATEPRHDSIGALRITEVCDRALASLAGRLGTETACADAAREFLGTALPGPGAHIATGDFSAFWTGPDQWMIDAPHDRLEDLAATLKGAVGDAGSVTEQTDGWCRYDLDGMAVPVLERLCAVDTRAMQTGQATRTVIEHLGCFLICRETALGFTVMGPRSSARSLHHALVTAARSVA